MKAKNSGVTLLELLIAITLFTLIIAVGGSVFLSTSNMAAGMLDAPQAQGNAQSAIMHIQKNVCNAASNFAIVGNSLTYMRYAGLVDIYATPTITSCYNLVGGQLRYYEDVNDISSGYRVVSDHIRSCTFTQDSDSGNILQVTVTAVDNDSNINNANAKTFTISTRIEAVNAPSQAVFTVS